MSTPAAPLSPEQQAAAVQAQLAQQATAVYGNPAAAGVYGDPAGAQAPSVPVDLSAAQPAVVDTDALLRQLQEQVATLQAAADAKAADEAAAAEAAKPKPVTLMDTISHGGVASGIMHAFSIIEERLSALEGKNES